MKEQSRVVSDFEQKIVLLKTDHNKALSQVRSEHAEKEKAMKIEHQNELEALRKSLGAASSDEMLRLQEKHAEEIKKLK